MTPAEVMAELKRKGSAQTKKTFARHGCPEPFFGVKIADLKTLVKKIKKDTPLAKELYRTGNSDAMYLAGLIGHGSELTRAELQEWAERATWSMLSDFTVPWMTAEHPEGWEIALGWIDSPDDKIAAGGWHALASIASVREDRELDLKALEGLVDRVVRTIGTSRNRTRYAMNGFLIAAGSAVKPLTKKALEAAARIGTVEVDMGDTSCKVPSAADYIRKVVASGRHGKKRASAKC